MMNCGASIHAGDHREQPNEETIPDNRASTKPIDPAWITDVLEFWFKDVGRTGWSKKNDAVDTLIRDRFLRRYEQIVANDCGAEVGSPRTVLASVIVFDQFARNMLRKSPRAFAADPIARRLAKTAVDQGLDAAMSKHERLFLYLPFEHSEDNADQALAFDLIESLGEEDFTRAVAAHKAIIDRFGRFPHRKPC